MNRSPRTIVAGIAGAFVLSSGIGYAAASKFDNEDGAKDPTSQYGTVQDGRTIGPASDDGSMPDLVGVVLKGGTEGYVESRLLTGPRFHSPEEAIAWQEHAPASWEIPAYARDGKTVIGSFTIQGPGKLEGVETRQSSTR